MDLGGLIVFLIIGAIAGWLAGKIMRGGGFGLIVNIIIGVIGSFIGGFILGLLGFDAYGFIAQLFSATIGAIALLWIVGMVKKS